MAEPAPSFNNIHIQRNNSTDKKIVLSKPISLESPSDSEVKYPNLWQRVLSLFKNIRPGSDLTYFQLPPVFNLPKSQLQYYGECVYSIASDVLSVVNTGKTALDRLILVLAWSFTCTRPPKFGVIGYNPILGETHHVSKGNLNVLLEQVSHHPPVTALHATDDKENIELIWSVFPVSKFHGTKAEGQMNGKRQLKLHNHGETYELNSPNFSIRILPVPGADWVGNVTIRCLETGLVAELSYPSKTFSGFGGKSGNNRRLIKGKIYEASSMEILCNIDGHWDSVVKVKDTSTGLERVIYDAKEVISGLQPPIVKASERVWPTESALVWGEVSQAILSSEWEKAREAKTNVEQRQRELLRERESKGETWVPQHFIVSHSREHGWECSPIQRWVPEAPIVTL